MRTILSAGLAINEILTEAFAAAGAACPVFPTAWPAEQSLPYASYARTETAAKTSKGGAADSAKVQVDIYTSAYAEGVELAETAREALDCVKGEAAGLVVRSITLEDAYEAAQPAANCYVQSLVFNVKI